MKHLKRTALAVMAIASFALLPAATASATTLEVGGVTQNETIALKMTLKAGTSIIHRDTFGFTLTTCTGSEMAGDTDSPYTGAAVTAGIDTLTFNGCKEATTVHKGGLLHISRIAGTTNGTVSSSGTEFTNPSPFGYIRCTTEPGTHLGTLTGVASGHATLDINAIVMCSSISSRLIGTYTVTGPTGLGVSV